MATQQGLAPFTHITSNVKDRISTGLDKCTAVVGPARSYKTALVRSVQLALTGTHPVGAMPKDLYKLLCPEDRDAGLPLSVSLQGPSGFAEWALPQEGGIPKKPGPSRYTGDLDGLTEMERMRSIPTAPIKDLLTGAALGRQALIQRFGAAVSLAVPSGLSEAQREGWTEGVEGVTVELRKKAKGKEPDAAEVLGALEGWFNRTKLAAGREIGALKKSVVRQRAELEGAGGTEVLTTLKKQLASAVAFEAVNPKRVRLRDLQVDRTALGAEIDLYRLDVKAHEDRKKAAGGLDAEAQSRLLIGGQWLLSQLEKNEPDCPCCRQAWEKAAREARTEVVRAAVAARQVSVDALGGGDLEAAATALRARQKDIIARRARLDSGIEELIAIVDTMKGPSTWDGPDSGTLKAQIATLEGLGELRRRIDSDADRQAGLEVGQAMWKKLQQRAGERLREVLGDVKAEAESVINRYMPTGYTASLGLDGGGCEWQVTGTDGVGHGRGIMCGSEQGALMVALGIAWTEGSPLRVLVLDDPDLGLLAADVVPKVLDVVRVAVESGVLTQAIVALSRPDEIPDGWTRVVRG